MSKEISKDVKVSGSIEKNAEAMQEQVAERYQKAASDPVYSASEFADNAKKIFGTRQECVVAALKAAGKSECTVSEAKMIVGKFLKREVK